MPSAQSQEAVVQVVTGDLVDEDKADVGKVDGDVVVDHAARNASPTW
jgi:hypothetical protein